MVRGSVGYKLAWAMLVLWCVMVPVFIVYTFLFHPWYILLAAAGVWLIFNTWRDIKTARDRS